MGRRKFNLSVFIVVFLVPSVFLSDIAKAHVTTTTHGDDFYFTLIFGVTQIFMAARKTSICMCGCMNVLALVSWTFELILLALEVNKILNRNIGLLCHLTVISNNQDCTPPLQVHYLK